MASYPPGNARIVLSGTLQGGEVWSTSYAINVGASQTQDTVNALAQQAFDLWKSTFLVTAVTSVLATTTVTSGARAYYYNGGSAAAIIGQSTGASKSGSSTSQALPNQVALVATLQTGMIGRSRRGRMYLPAFAANLLTNAQANTAVLPDIASALTAYLNAMNAFVAPGAGVGVLSATLGAMTDVKSIRIDSKFDTQRVRAQKQTPAGSSSGTLT